MRIKPLIGLMALAAIGLAACGGSRTYTTPGATAAPVPSSTSVSAASSTTPPSASRDPASIALEETPLGKILVDAEGRTLYAFTNDIDGASTCTGGCAQAWPAAIVAGASSTGPGITAPVSLIDAPTAGKMLKAGKWPLYRFVGDTAVGDTNGQGSGGTWFVVKADGTLVKN
jgi:predicted lipoprotein with Yx(FWY)xxD motif